MKKLGDDLKTAQASNLIKAQNEFFFRNAGQLSAAGSESGQTTLNYNLAISDSATAGEQWTKLQQAQEIVTPKIQPLRVNLPARGQRLDFAQVLQTVSGKPMTFVLVAENDKMIHWPSRLGTGLAAFLMLWVMVSVLSRVTQNRNVRRA